MGGWLAGYRSQSLALPPPIYQGAVGSGGGWSGWLRNKMEVRFVLHLSGKGQFLAVLNQSRIRKLSQFLSEEPSCLVNANSRSFTIAPRRKGKLIN